METFILLSQAAELTGRSENQLIELVWTGKIRAASILWDGVIIVSERDLESFIPLEHQPAYKQFSSLAGVAVGISEAAREYGIPQQTISRWVAKGMIKRLGTAGRKVLIDKSYIAYYAHLYHQAGGGQGRWVFTPTGALYDKKTKRKK